MTALVDTNVLVYRFDPRDSAKQRAARELLREGIEHDTLRVPHQAIVEFVQAVTRPLGRGKASPLARPDALREAEELLVQFEVLYWLLKISLFAAPRSTSHVQRSTNNVIRFTNHESRATTHKWSHGPCIQCAGMLLIIN